MKAVKSAVAGVVVVALGALPLAQAAQLAPEEKAFKGRKEVTDLTMGSMRGGFISADQILYFGVEMHTEWRNSAGELVGDAALNIGIDRTNSNVRPTVTISGNSQTPNAGRGIGAGNASSAQIGSGGTNQVQGVSQVVQTTGNGNGIANSISIDVGTRRPAMASASSSGGNTALVNGQSGVTAQTYINGNSAGVVVSVPAQGTASQSITSALGMQQRAQVYGDGNNIQNQLNMMIQVQTNSVSGAAQVNNLSQTMHGLWQAGLH